MFTKSLDNKKEITIDGINCIDLSESIFDKSSSMSKFTTLYKVDKSCEMRPDLISQFLYGTDEYTEMILKYSLINNPFSIEADDLIYGVSESYIYNPVQDFGVETTDTFEFIKNRHKYIDKNKIPTSPGSDKVTLEIPSDTGVEANISKTGDSGITVKDGKIYFGDIDATLQTVDSSLVECATNGTSLGDFLNATLKNYK